MKKKLLVATSNSLKFNLMKKRLGVFDNLELISPKDIGIKIEINENGKTAEDNSIKKAFAYYKVCKIPTIAEDSGLYIDKFKENEQPGLFVRRINGIDNLSNEEILKYYLKKISEYGGESRAHYYTGVALIDKNGIIHSDIFKEKDFLLTSKICPIKSLDGGILEPISFDIEANKYFDERNQEEEEQYYKELNLRYRQLVKDFILNQDFKV